MHRAELSISAETMLLRISMEQVTTVGEKVKVFEDVSFPLPTIFASDHGRNDASP